MVSTRISTTFHEPETPLGTNPHDSRPESVQKKRPKKINKIQKRADLVLCMGRTDTVVSSPARKEVAMRCYHSVNLSPCSVWLSPALCWDTGLAATKNLMKQILKTEIAVPDLAGFEQLFH